MARTEIAAEASLDTTKFQRGLAKADKGVKGFTKNALKSFGALAGASGLGALARSAIALGSQISDMAVQLNIGTTELQVLDFAAREAGVSTEIMARALRNVQLRTEEAIKGNKSYGDAFKALVIDIEAFKKLNVEQKMEAIAKAQANATDAGAAYNAVSRILGEKAGPALQEVLQNLAGPNGYKGLEDAAKSSGEVMSKEKIAKMDAAADKIESFRRKMTVLAGEILTKVIPAFRILGEGLGFVGEIFGAGLLNAKNYFSFLSSAISIVVEPAIKQFRALGKGIEAAMLAAKGEFKSAKVAMNEALEGTRGYFDAIAAAPGQISDKFGEMTKDVKKDFLSLGNDIERRAANISRAWGDMTGSMVDETKDANEKINENPMGSIGGGMSPQSGVSASGKSVKMGLDIERGEFESRKAFMSRRQRARDASLNLNEAKRKIAAGAEGLDVGALQQLKLVAMGGNSSDHESKMETLTQNISESIKTIERELS